MKDKQRNLNKELALPDFANQVFNFFQSIELNGQPIPAQEQFKARLQELRNGRKVPVVIFNCLDFEWIQDPNKYPQSIILENTDTAICKFFGANIAMLMNKLKTLGTPQLNIIIPDSELFDTRPFSFKQAESARSQIASTVFKNLPKELSPIDRVFDNSVVFWSEYCRKNNLQTPFEYTSMNIDRIRNDNLLMSKVRKQVKDSKKYFITRGLDPNYVETIDDEILNKTLAYLAMYAGEGQALADSRAIVINLEDLRVPTWFQRGANGELPILTPTNPTTYYKWRNQEKTL